MQENWISVLGSQTKKEAKISYLMVEEVAPPSYMWDKISQQLDLELQPAAVSQFVLSKKTTITLLISGSILAIAAILYFLL